MKKSLLMLISMLLVTTILVAVVGAYLKSVILEPLQLYQEESILSVPFLLMADDAAQYILKAAIDTVPATENETVETIESSLPPQQTEEPNVSHTVLPTEEPPTQPPTEPVVITESWFDDVLFIGDSRTFGMSCNHRLGKADYFSKGSMIGVTGRIQTGSYTNKSGDKVFTVDLFVEEAEFTESKGSKNNEQPKEASPSASDGFMNIPDGIDEELPFN